MKYTLTKEGEIYVLRCGLAWFENFAKAQSAIDWFTGLYPGEPLEVNIRA